MTSIQQNSEYSEWTKVKLPDQDGLLTEDDIKTLIAASDHPRNKALGIFFFTMNMKP